MNLPTLRTAVAKSYVPCHYNGSSKPEFNTMTSLTKTKQTKKENQKNPHNKT